ncbi:hypothetical protein ZWY2020_056723 [Hordeum vulgare]|nr:hypothetical protein ZWY2020_056723 [Hordeum vulgare]
MSIRPLWLPEPPPDVDRAPEIFAGGVAAVRRAVVIGNGCPGAENQCLGLVRALGLADRLTLYRIIRPTGGINKWLHFLPISLHKMVDQVLRHILSNGVHNTVSRKTGTLSSPDNVFVIQIQHPRYRLDRFDLVVTPRHDYYALTAKDNKKYRGFSGDGLLQNHRSSVLTAGALHQADSAALRISATNWHDALAPLPKPLVVVSIGGPTRNCNYGVDLAKQLVADLILREFSTHPKFYIWGGEADSISMLSEACSTGKPVYVVGTEHCRWKFSDFHNTLHKRGLFVLSLDWKM